MVNSRGCRRAEVVVAEIEPLDVEPPAKPGLLTQVDQDDERHQLRGAQGGGRNDDEGQRHLVGLVTEPLNRIRMREHAEPGDYDEEDEVPRGFAPPTDRSDCDGEDAGAGDVDEGRG